jgi:hypothetical protein
MAPSLKVSRHGAPFVLKYKYKKGQTPMNFRSNIPDNASVRSAGYVRVIDLNPPLPAADPTIVRASNCQGCGGEMMVTDNYVKANGQLCGACLERVKAAADRFNKLFETFIAENPKYFRCNRNDQLIVDHLLRTGKTAADCDESDIVNAWLYIRNDPNYLPALTPESIDAMTAKQFETACREYGEQVVIDTRNRRPAKVKEFVHLRSGGLR